MPTRITLSAYWKDDLQSVTDLMVEGHKIIIGYRKGQRIDTALSKEAKQTAKNIV
jgi:hypothetical protein